MKLGLCLVLLGALARAGSAVAVDYTDAEALALELSGELLAPPALTDVIDQHLQTIRGAEPTLVVVHSFPPWIPGHLWVRLTPSAFAAYQAGTYTGLDSLNAAYGPVEVVAEYAFVWTILMDFAANYSPLVLGPTYASADGVVSASPAGYGFQATDIWADSLGTYTFRLGWGDCENGCAYGHFWTYEIGVSGQAVLLAEWGDALTGLDAQEPVEGPTGALGAPTPNPFVSSVRITASIPSPGPARMDIVDVGGRHVRALFASSERAGPVQTRWDGKDDHGRALAAGVYFVVLRTADGVLGSRQVVLVR